MTHWGLWWKFNKESLLDLRTRLSRGMVISGNGAWGRPSEGLINDRVLPVLFDSMEDASYDGLISGSIVALGRIGAPQDARMAAAFEAAFGRKSGEIRETAALGLGLLGRHNSMERLTGLLSDPESYRKDFGYTANDRMRAYSAYGIGFLAKRSPIQDVKHLAVLRLLERISDKREKSDVRVASLNALSIIDLAWKDSSVPLTPSSHREGLIAFLLEMYEDGSDDELMAHLPVAIARLLRGASPLRLEAATRRLLASWGPRLDRNEAAALVLAFGESEAYWDSELGREITKLLEKIARTGDEAFPRRLAMISLARLASKPDVDGVLNTAALAYFEKLLIDLRKRGRSADRPWIGLASASYNARVVKLKGTVGPALLAMLRELIEEGGSADTASTAAFALGLSEDHASGPFLAKQLEEASSSSLRGFLATAIGLVGYIEAKPLLIETLEKVRFSPTDLENTSIGLALIDQVGTAVLLRKMLKDTNLTSLAGSLAYTLGRISDAAAVPQIARMYAEKASGLTRTYIVIALGLSCERGRLPWFVELSEGSNYAAWSPSLFDSAGKGVLNLF
ncbi:MAG: hypothetical protein ACI9D0_000205 [Bacteroidia bacterium]|jgi:hypothetical protein